MQPHQIIFFVSLFLLVFPKIGLILLGIILYPFLGIFYGG